MKELIQQEVEALQRLAQRQPYSFDCGGCGNTTNRVELVMDRLAGGQINIVRQRICDPCAIKRYEGGEFVNGTK